MTTKKIVLQGIPFDEKSSFLQGPALAPARIRAAYHSSSANYFAENGLEITPNCFEDCGDLEIKEYFDIATLTTEHLKKGLPILSLGGDHSVTFPLLQAINQVYGPVHILHIDAHADLYNDFQGDPFSHACPFARILEHNLASSLTQVGIRTHTRHQREQAGKFGVTTIEMKDFDLAKIPSFRGPLYVSLDIDALDPAFAPGVSHYEPGGLSTREVIGIIQRLQVPILGADIVEYNPERDTQGITAMLCAKLLKELAAKMLENS